MLPGFDFMKSGSNHQGIYDMSLWQYGILLNTRTSIFEIKFDFLHIFEKNYNN